MSRLATLRQTREQLERRVYYLGVSNDRLMYELERLHTPFRVLLRDGENHDGFGSLTCPVCRALKIGQRLMTAKTVPAIPEAEETP